jgi:hypothetical protein
MPIPNLASVRQQLERTVGPAPWYWKTFPAFRSASGQKFVWTHHGEEGPVAYLVTLALEQEPEKPRLALNTYCRPFIVSPQCLGIWCPEGRNIRLAGFDPDQLKAFDMAEIAGWFKQSSDRIYSATEPLADFEVPLTLEPGMHKIEVPAALAAVDELIAPTSYKALSNDDPAFALFVFYLQAGLVEVLPQKWFTAAQYQVGKQWISRAAREQESQRIFGECFGAGTFLLEEDGCRLAEWIEKVGS